MIAVVGFVAAVVLWASIPLVVPAARRRKGPSWARGPIRAARYARRSSR